MSSSRPIQRISYSKKIAKDKDGVCTFGKENIEYYSNNSTFSVGQSTGSDVDDQMLYDLYNNILPDKWFNYVKNPINSKKSEYKNFPARIRPYTIIRPNIDLLWGEYPKRPFNYQVINAGHDAWNTFLEKKKEVVETNLQQHFINHANAQGVDTGEESKDVPLPAELMDDFVSSYNDLQAIKGQRALKIIEEENGIKEIFNDLFKDYLIAGKTFSYKGIRNGDIDYERVSPLECDYDKSSNSKYIEDGEWFTRRYMLTVSDIIDRFEKELKESNIEDIENQTNSVGSAPTTSYDRVLRGANNKEDRRAKIEVLHAVWKSQMKIGTLTYPDPMTGQPQQMEVDEDYKPDKLLGESVEWDWVTQVWETYRIDNKYYIGTRPLPVQRNKMNGQSYCKLPYNGRRFSDTQSTNISALQLGVPFQIMHIILKYRLEMTIAKSKGKIALLDLNVIPSKPGWDEEKFLYYSEALGYGFIDRSKPGVDKSYNQYQVLDLTLFDHIEQVLKLIDSNKREWDEVLGINPYRKGQTQASDAVSNVQQGIFQSSIISDMLFIGFEDFIKTEYKGLLDYSKFAWKDGKKKLYRTDELTTELFDIDPEDYLAADFDIFVTNSSKEADKLNALKGAAQAFAQNASKPSVVAEVIGADSFIEVKHLLKKLEKMEQDVADKTAANEQDGEKQKLMITQQFEKMKEDFQLELIDKEYEKKGEMLDKEYDRKEQLEYVVGDVALAASPTGMDSNMNGVPDINEIEKRAVEREKMYLDSSDRNRETALKTEDLRLQNKAIDSKERTEKFKGNIQLQVARANKNKYDGKK